MIQRMLAGREMLTPCLTWGWIKPSLATHLQKAPSQRHPQTGTAVVYLTCASAKCEDPVATDGCRSTVRIRKWL